MACKSKINHWVFQIHPKFTTPPTWSDCLAQPKRTGAVRTKLPGSRQMYSGRQYLSTIGDSSVIKVEHIDSVVEEGMRGGGRGRGWGRGGVPTPVVVVVVMKPRGASATTARPPYGGVCVSAVERIVVVEVVVMFVIAT